MPIVSTLPPGMSALDPDARAAHPSLAGFRAPVRRWFAACFESPTRAQELAWPLIAAGENTLILAPTGSGKTLAAFLAAIDRLMFDPPPAKGERCRILYVSPLKALAVDVERNLRAPLVGVARYAERSGEPFHMPEVAIRTGDTPARERARFQRQPADILITTPESLYLLLTSGAREALRSVRWVIVDEIHAMLGTKRGAHFALSLERLEELTGGRLQRIGLSATVRPVEEAARFLGGFETPPGPDPGDVAAEPAGDADWLELVDSGLPGDMPDVPTRSGSATPGTSGDAPSPAALRTPGEDGRSVPDGAPASNGDPDRGEGGAGQTARRVAVADAGRAKRLDLRIEVAVEDMAKIGQAVEIPSGPAAQGERRTSIWPAIHPMVLERIRSHRSTLIFVNSRRLAERLAQSLNETAGEEIVRAHHGSIAREQRLQIEDDLKAGRLPALVATSSLELGIDMGAIDLVIQVEAPPSVGSGIQRIGRAGHQIDAPSEGIILPKFRGDLLACASLAERMQAGAVEPVRFPRNPLDVLAQQIVAMAAMDEWGVDHLERVVRRAAPFAELPRRLLEDVLDMLSGRYPSDDFAELRPRITWDRLAGTIRAREGAKRVAISNSGTIPDRGLFGVFLLDAERPDGRGSLRVGELDEEMVFESREGETFLLGASTWRIERITHDRVLVSPAPGEPGKMPFWRGESAGRPLEFGRAIGALCRRLREAPRDAAVRLLMERHALTQTAAINLVQYLDEQREATGAVPDDRTIVVERYMDEMGDWRVCILCPFGSRVLAPWAMAVGAMIRERTDLETDILWTDDGIVIRLPESDEPPQVDWLIPDPEEVEELVIRQLGQGSGARGESHGVVNALFASRFREAAGRALLIPKKRPGQRAPLWQQRKRAADLLHATAKFGSFPIVLETYREILRDHIDMPALVELLRQLRNRSIRTVAVTTRAPSPFAASLLFHYVANFMYEGDAPLAERRAQALVLDQTRLRELIGEVELRDLLDPEALEDLELQLQCLTEDRKARHPDALHDLLLRLGDLSEYEIAARCADAGDGEQRGGGPDATPAPGAGLPAGVRAWIDSLERQRRIVRLRIAGEERYIAAEDAGRYRDALGIPPPPGLPAAFLEFVSDPVGDLVARYARTHGPFHAAEIAARLGTGTALVLSALGAYEQAGRVLQGEFRPGGAGREWCDAGVMRLLRQRSLARLRREAEPVDAAALGRLYLAWQGVAEPRRGRDALLETIEQLQGAALPASDLERRILPARLERFDPAELDALTASGQVVWVGVEALGERDGRVSLYLAEHAAELLPIGRSGAAEAGSGSPPIGSGSPHPGAHLHDRIRAHLAARGASFFPQILAACGSVMPQEAVDALWDLVWSGEATNDTLAPLRAYLHPRRRPRSAYGRLGGRPRGFLPPETSGRWSLVGSLAAACETERAAARARQLLERYGVLTREAVRAEGGSFPAVYGVLKALEEAGRIRRGYFVAGRGATQFALPGAVDRLRELREPPGEPAAVLLAADDPANPYGAALPWPSSTPDGAGSARRPMRAAGAIVVLVNGAPAAWMGRAERNLVTFLDGFPERDRGAAMAATARALAGEVTGGARRAVFVRDVDGRPAQQTPMGAALAAEGFTFGPRGYMLRG